MLAFIKNKLSSIYKMWYSTAINLKFFRLGIVEFLKAKVQLYFDSFEKCQAL